jgi:hypothetical protein
MADRTRPNRRRAGDGRLHRGDLTWRAAPRFLDDYRRAAGPLRALAEGEIQHMQIRAGSSADWTTSYRALKGLPGVRILELELGGGPRALANVEGRVVTLLAMGDHEVTARYVRRRAHKDDLAAAVELPAAFHPGHRNAFFPAATAQRPERLQLFANEVSPEWLYFLDDEQDAICQAIVDDVEEVLLSDDVYTVHFIVGGPGTGKTSILLQLLMRLSDEVVPSIETWRVRIQLSNPVADFVTAETGWKLDRCRQPGQQHVLDVIDGADVESGVDVLLVDDPGHVYQIKARAQHTQAPGGLKALVVAFDPLQLNESLSDSSYRKLVREHEVMEHKLRTCYRQKEAVGRAAVGVAEAVAASSPFLDDRKKERYTKERSVLTALANRLTFRNPSGYAVTYEAAELSDWKEYVAWVARQPGRSAAWPRLLVVVDGGTSLPRTWRRVAELVHHELISLEDIGPIKGLEYHHVALVLSDDRYDAVQKGFSGTGRRLYDDYRLLRIPFTRAKDSLAVFVR